MEANPPPANHPPPVSDAASVTMAATASIWKRLILDPRIITVFVALLLYNLAAYSMEPYGSFRSSERAWRVALMCGAISQGICSAVICRNLSMMELALFLMIFVMIGEELTQLLMIVVLPIVFAVAIAVADHSPFRLPLGWAILAAFAAAGMTAATGVMISGMDIGWVEAPEIFYFAVIPYCFWSCLMFASRLAENRARRAVLLSSPGPNEIDWKWRKKRLDDC